MAFVLLAPVVAFPDRADLGKVGRPFAAPTALQQSLVPGSAHAEGPQPVASAPIEPQTLKQGDKADAAAPDDGAPTGDGGAHHHRHHDHADKDGFPLPDLLGPVLGAELDGSAGDTNTTAG